GIGSVVSGNVSQARSCRRHSTWTLQEDSQVRWIGSRSDVLGARAPLSRQHAPSVRAILPRSQNPGSAPTAGTIVSVFRRLAAGGARGAAIAASRVFLAPAEKRATRLRPAVRSWPERTPEPVKGES